MNTPEDLIRDLGLEPRAEEGGYFRETYRSEREFDPGSPYPGRRSWATAIHYLLTADTFSAMHRLPGDEIFHCSISATPSRCWSSSRRGKGGSRSSGPISGR